MVRMPVYSVLGWIAPDTIHFHCKMWWNAKFCKTESILHFQTSLRSMEAKCYKQKEDAIFQFKRRVEWDFKRGKCQVLVWSRGEVLEEDHEVVREGEGGFLVSRFRAGLFGRRLKRLECIANFFPSKNKMTIKTKI